MSPILYALILGLWGYIGFYDALAPNILQAERPLIAGTVAGLVVGNVQMGMLIGGTLELMALGVYTYGGATIPDYQSGAILGTYFAVVNGNNFSTGLALAIPAALLLTQVDILNRFLNFVFVHRADAYAQAGDSKGFERMMVLYSHMIWGLSRGLPVFLAIAFGQPLVAAVSTFFNNYPWINTGIKTVGGILPALGFAMLLKIMPVNKYPAFLVLGFVMFAYLKIPLLGIAIAAVAIALIFQSLKYQTKEA
ncbi:MAG: PTS sugar transporter subunit IIC [Anaerolineaceae bacterium]|jgi:PTS system mannose-specific IIC component